uniref:Uncharacterized protein n=1 Tax=Chromera velia CCMP2878 TaxID=1169474 RepID=A0A0G4HKS7_9ALVE|eukprot:Cvel_1131.t1-p1 / transcript=Cvel_1131.t1 / gene=Cvel_1131 / organism=Chromera_velia_CCMP2878 / gene_product=hypothetical protein / transcript_product=hypothetical protein / location=Cvel_scaffold37:79243-83588(-) / protein_length=412 / sequence_SO=supercontig / SO=protein_coding / is_pseudo=false
MELQKVQAQLKEAEDEKKSEVMGDLERDIMRMTRPQARLGGGDTAADRWDNPSISSLSSLTKVRVWKEEPDDSQGRAKGGAKKGILLRVGQLGVEPSHVNQLRSLVESHHLVLVKDNDPAMQGRHAETAAALLDSLEADIGSGAECLMVRGNVMKFGPQGYLESQGLRDLNDLVASLEDAGSFRTLVQRTLGGGDEKDGEELPGRERLRETLRNEVRLFLKEWHKMRLERIEGLSAAELDERFSRRGEGDSLEEGADFFMPSFEGFVRWMDSADRWRSLASDLVSGKFGGQEEEWEGREAEVPAETAEEEAKPTKKKKTRKPETELETEEELSPSSSAILVEWLRELADEGLFHRWVRHLSPGTISVLSASSQDKVEEEIRTLSSLPPPIDPSEFLREDDVVLDRFEAEVDA